MATTGTLDNSKAGEVYDRVANGNIGVWNNTYTFEQMTSDYAEIKSQVGYLMERVKSLEEGRQPKPDILEIKEGRLIIASESYSYFNETIRGKKTLYLSFSYADVIVPGNTIIFKGMEFLITEGSVSGGSSVSHYKAVGIGPFDDEVIMGIIRDQEEMDKQQDAKSLLSGPYSTAQAYTLHSLALCSLIIDGVINVNSFNNHLYDGYMPRVCRQYRVLVDDYATMCESPMSYMRSKEATHAIDNILLRNHSELDICAYVRALKEAYKKAAKK